ncbi:pentapeptide repeat-containing protein [Pedobacter caeni]|uniref:pentapeptide repeat-containing protein n=1 Tax=Pedobacter caeni TaxID=288992 RepID=UPI0013565565
MTSPQDKWKIYAVVLLLSFVLFSVAFFSTAVFSEATFSKAIFSGAFLDRCRVFDGVPSDAMALKPITVHTNAINKCFIVLFLSK